MARHRIGLSRVAEQTLPLLRLFPVATGIHLDVTDADGKVANWGVEMNPANNLVRAGWRSTTLKPGDKVTIVVYPLRNDEKGGQYISITLPDGKVLGERESGVI